MSTRKKNSTNYLNEQKLTASCPMTLAMNKIGGRWKMVMLYQISIGNNRYGSLQRAIPLITEKMLTTQLRELEADNLVDRLAYPEVPPRVEYNLTEEGRGLLPIMEQLTDWGAKINR